MEMLGDALRQRALSAKPDTHGQCVSADQQFSAFTAIVARGLKGSVWRLQSSHGFTGQVIRLGSQ